MNPWVDYSKEIYSNWIKLSDLHGFEIMLHPFISVVLVKIYKTKYNKTKKKPKKQGKSRNCNSYQNQPGTDTKTHYAKAQLRVSLSIIFICESWFMKMTFYIKNKYIFPDILSLVCFIACNNEIQWSCH